VPIEKLNDYWSGETVRKIVFEFLDSPESQAIFFREARGSIEVSEQPIKVPKSAIFYIVKLGKTQISEGKIGQEIVYGDIGGDPLESLSALAEKIYHPVIGSKDATQTWSETITKDVRECFESFVSNVQITQGHLHGITCLPLPGSGGASRNEPLKEGETEDDISNFIHSLESAIIIWTKQIKNVLKQDPESVLVNLINPGPLAEVEFWKSKAGNLNGIFSQLQSTRIRRVLKVLDKSKSTYNAPFAKVIIY